MVTLEELVPADHLLRLIDRHIPFDFIRDATAHLYCADNGRPAVDPVQLFKMLFIGYLFGIRSERQLVREIQVNVAYRWFLGLGLTDRVIDASTFSQNRRRRFSGSDIEQTIFDHIVETASERLNETQKNKTPPLERDGVCQQSETASAVFFWFAQNKARRCPRF